MRHLEPLSRDLCITLIADIIEDQRSLEALTLFNEAQDSSSAEMIDVRSKAGYILRYLTDSKWLRAEPHGDFTVSYILPDYAFRLLGVFHELATSQEQPLQGLICEIHDLLQATIKDGKANVRLPQAHRETQRLLNSLKELQHTIGLHINTVLAQVTLRDILEKTFLSSLYQTTRRTYHELRTTDHVSRFRPGIHEALARLRAEYFDISLTEHHNDAISFTSNERGQLLEQLEDIQVHFDTLDTLLETIDVRHSQFFDSAARAIEYRLSANTRTSGHLRTILEFLLDPQRPLCSLDEQVSGEEEDASQLNLDSIINVYSLSLLEGRSLMSPRRTAEPFEPGPDTSTELSEEEILAAQEETITQLSRSFSRERVRRFAQKLLANNDELLVGDVALNGPEELPLLIYLRLYGDGTLGYVCEEFPEALWIEQVGIGFRDFRIKRA